MKTKKVFKKKLGLIKNTVADLTNAEQSKILGGWNTIYYTICVTNCAKCPTVKCY